MILHLCVDDWANFMLGQHKALLSVGVDSVALKMNKHVFNYPEQVEIANKDYIKEVASQADTIVLYHSDFELLPLIPQGKRVFIYHTGTKYRTRWNYINEVAESTKLTPIIALPEFASRCYGDYVVGAVDTDSLQGNINAVEPVKFGHFPSNPGVKGTQTIREVFGSITSLNAHLIIKEDRVSYPEQIERMKSIDVCVELLNPSLQGSPYGSFGMTALEASALGKIVVTQNVTGQTLYKSVYGDTPMLFVNDREDLKKKIYEVIEMGHSGRESLAEKHRQWVVEKHGLQATGRRLLEVIHGL